MRTLRAIGAVIGVGGILAACTPGAMIDKLPEDVGLPAGAPARPTQAYDYPAVHDMPPPRAEPALTDEQQLKMEKDLEKVRDRQEGRVSGDQKTAPKPKKPAKKPDQNENTGAKTNP